jgi:hypothetical protein
MSMIAKGEPRRHGSVWPWLSVIPLLGLIPVLWAAGLVKRSLWSWLALACLFAWVAVFVTIDSLEAVSEALLWAAWLGQIVAAAGLQRRLRAETRGVSDEELPGLQQVRAADALATVQRRAGIPDRPGGGGTLFTEPVLFLEGTHRSDYRFFGRDALLVAAIARAAESLEVRDCDDRCLLLLGVGSHSSDDVLRDAEGIELVRLRRMTKTDDDRPNRRLRDPGTRSILLHDHVIGHVLARNPKRSRGSARIVVDRSGVDVAHIVRTLGGAGPGGTARRFVIDVREHADERLRAVALVAPVVWDFSIVSWDAGG